MAEISREELKEEIHAILKTADLNVVSAKKIREQVEKKLNCSLLSRKKECDDIVMDYMTKESEEEEKKANNKSDEEKSGEGEESGSEEEEEVVVEKEKKPAKKKKATPSKAPSASKKRAASAKKKKWSSNASDSGSTSDDDDSDYEQPKPTKKKNAEKKKAAAGGAEGVKRITGYTKALKLSPDLAALVGAEALSRHEVVKKVWAIIKERRLADPNNKQFTICDDQLYTVMKVKRFRTFGMLKHLKPHFID